MMTFEEFLTQWHDDSDCLLVHTSGSTGEPKPLWVQKSRMLASARTTCDFLGLHSGDTALLCLPLDFIAGKMMVVRALERSLRLVIVEPGGHPLSNLQSSFYDFQSAGSAVDSQMFINGQLDFVAMVPLQVWNSLQIPEERERLRQIRHLIIGGGPVDDRLADALADFPNAVWSTYGMTETLSHIALRRLNGPERSEWYAPFDGVTVSLNADGCLVIDAPQLCAEQLVTNDRAEMRGRSFRILGRRDNVVCTGGMKIQMEDVERKLAPYVSVPFLITKCPDERLGETVVMLVENGADSVEDQAAFTDIQAICQRVLTRYEQPRRFLRVEKLPMTGTGKPARSTAERMATVLSAADRAIISRR